LAARLSESCFSAVSPPQPSLKNGPYGLGGWHALRWPCFHAAFWHSSLQYWASRHRPHKNVRRMPSPHLWHGGRTLSSRSITSASRYSSSAAM